MNLKIIIYIVSGLFILVLIGGVGYSIVRKTEGYRADNQEFYSFEPHILGGCAMYKAYQKAEKKPIIKPEAKKEVKK